MTDAHPKIGPDNGGDSIDQRVAAYLDRLGLPSLTTRVRRLHGDASSRSYTRVTRANGSSFVLAVHAEPFATDALPQINVSAIFKRLEIPVPKIIDQAGDLGILALSDLGDETLQGLVGGKTAVGDGSVDAGHVLYHDTSRAEVGVTDLRIAHLAARQPDVSRRCIEQRMGAMPPQAVVDGRCREGNRVVLGVFAVPPAVQHAQDEGPGATSYRHDASISHRELSSRACRRRPLLAMIGVAAQQTLGTKQLLGQHAAHQKVRPSHRAERQN